MLRSYAKMYPVAAMRPDYEPPQAASAAAVAAARGVPPLQVVLDWMDADGGEGLVYFPIFNYSYNDFSHLHALLQHPSTMISLADGGAHCGMIVDAGLPTYMLTHWTRDRTRGPTLPLEDIVRRQTSHTASVFSRNARSRSPSRLRTRSLRYDCCSFTELVSVDIFCR
jgi:N-acyl-D-aspartate/D-glutamate deacylase